MKKKILFLCTHNSARSQMAEGLMNHFHGDKFSASSAGTEKTTVNPNAILALKELGIDISHHFSKTIETFMNSEFDVVVTVCDNAKEACPFFPGKVVIHKSFEDPSSAATEQQLDAFRKTRDEIRHWLDTEFLAIAE